MKLYEFPENDIILARLEKVEDLLLIDYESIEPNLHLDSCIVSLQNCINQYRLFVGVVAQDQNHNEAEGKENI